MRVEWGSIGTEWAEFIALVDKNEYVDVAAVLEDHFSYCFQPFSTVFNCYQPFQLLPVSVVTVENSVGGEPGSEWGASSRSSHIATV